MQWVIWCSQYLQMMQVWRVCRGRKQSRRRHVVAPTIGHEPHIVSRGAGENKRVTERGVDDSMLFLNPWLPPVVTTDEECDRNLRYLRVAGPALTAATACCSLFAGCGRSIADIVVSADQ